MSDAHASMLVGIFLGCTALGGLLGGWLGDRAAQVSPKYGRIAVCQFSVFAGVPLSLILLKAGSNNIAIANVENDFGEMHPEDSS